MFLSDWESDQLKSHQWTQYDNCYNSEQQHFLKLSHICCFTHYYDYLCEYIKATQSNISPFNIFIPFFVFIIS